MGALGIFLVGMRIRRFQQDFLRGALGPGITSVASSGAGLSVRPARTAGEQDGDA